MMPGLMSSVAADAAVTVSTNRPVYTQTTSGNGSSVTMTGAALSSAASDRYIVVGVTNRNPSFFGSTGAVSAVTVAGQSCTKVADIVGAGFNRVRSTLWITDLPVTSGTTGNVVVTFAGSNDYGIAIWAMYGPNSPTPYDTAAATGTSTIDHPANGMLVAIGGSQGSSSMNTAWSGATEDFEGSMEGEEYSGASGGNLSNVAGQTINAAFTNDGSFAAATWSPA